MRGFCLALTDCTHRPVDVGDRLEPAVLDPLEEKHVRTRFVAFKMGGQILLEADGRDWTKSLALFDRVEPGCHLACEWHREERTVAECSRSDFAPSLDPGHNCPDVEPLGDHFEVQGLDSDSAQVGLVNDKFLTRVNSPLDLGLPRVMAKCVGRSADGRPGIVRTGRNEDVVKQAELLKSSVPFAIQTASASDQEWIAGGQVLPCKSRESAENCVGKFAPGF